MQEAGRAGHDGHISHAILYNGHVGKCLDKRIKGAVDLKHQLFTTFLFVVFRYMSAGCVSTFRTCVQVLEKLPFLFCFSTSFQAL